jgi:release factor glutamine methyltransferase
VFNLNKLIDAGWSSPVARQAHNLKAAGSNPAPATKTMNSNTTILQILSQASSRLSSVGISTAKLDARVLLEHALGISREQLFLAYDRALPIELASTYNALIERRARFEPISHIIGKREFYGLEFKVNKHTLDPRPDSELIVEQAIKYARYFQEPKILDLGTGSGCLLLSILYNIQSASGLGIDISDKAIIIAEENAAQLGLIDRVKFEHKSWNLANFQTFDIVISNPPYIPLNEQDNLSLQVINYDPHQALFGGEDGLDCYRQIAKLIPSLLYSDGFLILEIGIHQHDDVILIMEEAELKLCSSHQDLAGITRCLVFKASH